MLVLGYTIVNYISKKKLWLGTSYLIKELMVKVSRGKYVICRTMWDFWVLFSSSIYYWHWIWAIFHSARLKSEALPQALWERQSRLSLTLNSLRTLPLLKYNLIILDYQSTVIQYPTSFQFISGTNNFIQQC